MLKQSEHKDNIEKKLLHLLSQWHTVKEHPNLSTKIQKRDDLKMVNYGWRYPDAKSRHFPIKKSREIINWEIEKFPCVRNISTYMESKNPSTFRIQQLKEILFVLSMEITKRQQVEFDLQQLNEELEVKVGMRMAELVSKNKDILASINYAKKIQNAFHPNISDLLTLLPNAFVLSKPKDILSGDFVWFKEIDGKIFLAAVDCTGHGVPGALMSMIGSQKLNEAVVETTDPSAILKYLNQSVKKALRQNESYSSSRDGMDIALCCIDKEKREIKYSGANRPLWIMCHGEHELWEIEATKKAIGGFTEDEQHFETHSIQLKEGDTFYICSDGYADQFGGERQKKLTTKKFKHILQEIQHKSLSEQEVHLTEFSKRWLGENDPVDDILVVGVRL